MTVIDPTQQIDPFHAATGLMSLVSALKGLNARATSDQSGASTIAQTAETTPAQSASASTSTSGTQTTTSGGTADAGSGTVDPVPEGTAVTQGYGVNGHPGIDLGVPLNTQLLAAQSGTVTVASDADPEGYGLEVEIATPDGYHIRYGHLNGVNVKVGDQVQAGQLIGISGGEQGGPNSGNSKGPHLHFEVRGPDGNTVDPTPWLAGGHAVVQASPSTVTASVPNVTPSAAAATGVNRLAGIITGQGDPGSPNAQTKTQTGTTTATTSGSTSDTDPNAVDAFLAATRQHESGGNYQIYNESGLSNASGAYQFLNSTWQGLGGSTTAAAQASPEEQDRIARNYAMQLFNQFHSWRLVAIAWYGGPGIAQQVAAGQDPGSPQGQGSYLAYGDTIASMMSGGK